MTPVEIYGVVHRSQDNTKECFPKLKRLVAPFSALGWGDRSVPFALLSNILKNIPRSILG